MSARATFRALIGAATLSFAITSAHAIPFGPDLTTAVPNNPYTCSFPFATSPPGIYPFGCTTADPAQTSMSFLLPDPVVHGNQTGVVTTLHVLSAATAPAQFIVVAYAGTPAVIEPPFPSAVTAVSEQVMLHPGLNNFNTNLPVEFTLHPNGYETWSIVSLNILDGSSPLPAQLGGEFSTTGLLFDNGRPLTATAVDLTIPPHNVAISGYPPMTLLMSGDMTITTGGRHPLGTPDLAAEDALVRGNRLLVDLICSAGGPCPGHLLLQDQPAPGAAVAGREHGSLATLEPRARVVTYGKARFKLFAGQTAMLPVPLKAAGRRLVRGGGTPTMWANIKVKGSTQVISRQVTLTH